jgi:hypothetical protein
MNWQVIATIAEVAAAIGVIVSLVYLARQIRQSTLDSEASANQEAGRDHANHLSVVMSDENTDAFIKGLNSYASLSPAERYKFDFCMGGYLNIVEVILLHNEAGRGFELLEMVTNNYGPRVFAYPGAKEWWDHGKKGGFGKSTQQWVDMMIEKNAGVPGFWEYGSPSASATTPKPGSNESY